MLKRGCFSIYFDPEASGEFLNEVAQQLPMWYEVSKDTVYNYNSYYHPESYFKKGDQIKCEEVDEETIKEAISIIKKNVELDKNTTISLFHLDQSTFKKYNHETISSFYSSFSK